MDERSMLDIAYEIIGKEKAGVKFNDLFDQICTLKEKDDAAKATLIGRFYSDLLLDGRFLVLDDNVWDLRERYTFDKAHTEMDVYQNIDQSDESDEDKEDNKEYDAAMTGKSVEDLVEEKGVDGEKDSTDGDGTAA